MIVYSGSTLPHLQGSSSLCQRELPARLQRRVAADGLALVSQVATHLRAGVDMAASLESSQPQALWTGGE